MSLEEKDIRKIAKLARIGLHEGDTAHFTAELNAILHWVEQLQQVDTAGVEQMTSVANISLPLREDVVADGNIRDAVLKNAPQADYGCFIVPKVIE